MNSMRLTPQLLLTAYSRGIFPMADEDGTLDWYDVDPRAIIPLDGFHVPRSLRQTVRKRPFDIRCNTAFEAVMQACAAPDQRRGGSWISAEMIAVYTELHRMGFAHSVECWRDDELAGGLYGVALGGLFAGESMFTRVTDASKVALVHLVERLRAGGFVLLDTQYLVGDHIRRFGAIEIPRAEYHRRLRIALETPAVFTCDSQQ